MGYDNPLQNEYEGFRQRAARIEGDWCDDCHGYTHMPYCPSYEKPSSEQPASGRTEEIDEWYVASQSNVEEGDATIRRRKGDQWIGQVKCKEAARITNDHNQHQQCAAQLRFLGNRAEELSSLLAGMTTERDELREVVSGLRANLQSRKFCSSCDHDYCQMGNELLTVITKDPATTTNQPEQAE